MSASLNYPLSRYYYIIYTTLNLNYTIMTRKEECKVLTEALIEKIDDEAGYLTAAYTQNKIKHAEKIVVLLYEIDLLKTNN